LAAGGIADLDDMVADSGPPVSSNGTNVGLDVHALSVVAHTADEETGRVERARLCPDSGEILAWLRQLRARVRVAYEVVLVKADGALDVAAY
jgi:hypothetical protein